MDLELSSPLIKEEYAISIKSQADVSEFEEFREKTGGTSYRKAYFVVHSPSLGLEDLVKSEQDTNFEIVLADEVSRWAVSYGLADWILDKAM